MKKQWNNLHDFDKELHMIIVPVHWYTHTHTHTQNYGSDFAPGMIWAVLLKTESVAVTKPPRIDLAEVYLRIFFINRPIISDYSCLFSFFLVYSRLIGRLLKFSCFFVITRPIGLLVGNLLDLDQLYIGLFSWTNQPICPISLLRVLSCLIWTFSKWQLHETLLINKENELK